MIFANHFAYRTSQKNWEDAPDQDTTNELSDVIVAFIQGEAGDVDKAPPEFVMELFDKVQAKLENAGYEVHQTPFGYFLDLEMRAPGFSLARVFKDL